MAIRLVLADDHPIVLSGLKGLLSTRDDFEIMATCTNGEDALDAVQKHKPDIIVLDIRMPRMDGMAVVKAIHNRNIAVKIVILTADMCENDTVQIIRMGVKGVVLKEMAPELLIRCLHKVNTGGLWVERLAFNQAMDKMLQREDGMKEVRSLLTNREIDILKMVAKGLRNKEIGNEMNISALTVKTHLHNIFKKLDIDSRPKLIRYAHDKWLN